MQNKMGAGNHDVYFGNIAWQLLTPGDNWRKIALEAFDEGKPKKTAVCKFGNDLAIGSVQEAATGIPAGALFARWCGAHKIPYAMYIDHRMVVAVIDGVPRAEKFYEEGAGDSAAAEYAAEIRDIMYPTGCLIFGDNHLPDSTPLSFDNIADEVYAQCKKEHFAFQNSISYAVPIALAVILVAGYFGYDYYQEQERLARKSKLEQQALMLEAGRDLVKEYIDAQNQELLEITPALCSGRRFSQYADLALRSTSTNANGWTWLQTVITCDQIVSQYKRDKGTNETLRQHIAANPQMIADFKPDMTNAEIRLNVPEMKENLISPDFSAHRVAIPADNFFFTDGSEMQIISDNVSVRFTIDTPKPVKADVPPVGVNQVKKSAFAAKGDGRHWRAVSARFFEKDYFLISKMVVTPVASAKVGDKESILFSMEGIYLVY